MDSTFRFAPDILRRLGEELNPSADQGILELVKNSYDANAVNCEVELVETHRPGGRVVITDDGDGLTDEAIRDGWLVLGRSAKSATKPSRLGRLPAGNKGLGRLAALRLGHVATLGTNPRGSRTAWNVVINWDLFESVELVGDVVISIDPQPRARGDRDGTSIEIAGLRDRMRRMEVKRLARAMVLLADPFGDDPTGFRPRLEAPEFADLERLVSERYFQDADFHLLAELRGGRARAQVLDWRGEVLFEAKHEELTRDSTGEIAYGAPDAKFDLWAFLLNQASFASRSVSLAEVREWIDAFGGVHLYLNDLRVAPYGNSGNDWLDMNLRRVQSPEERPGTNTSIGRISVIDAEEALSQKTDRSGFIENEAFEQLRKFGQDSLDWMARVRLQAAEARRRHERATTPTKTSRSRESLAKQIDRAPKSIREDLQEALTKYDTARERETNALRREVQLYRTLSTAGITAATFAHESAGSPLKVINQALGAIEFRGKRQLGEDYAATLEGPIRSLRRAASALGVLSSATLRLIDSDKRRVGRVDLDKLVARVVADFEPFLDGRDAKVGLSLESAGAYLRGAEAAVESIVANLLNNALAAFENDALTERLIQVSTTVSDDIWALTIADSGPGILGIATKSIWLPGETTRTNGTGLGLTIVRDATSDLGGSATATASGALGGASFTIELPILGVTRDN